MDTHLNPWLFCICRSQKACFQCRAGYQEETIKGKEWAFKLGPFDCVTDWFQVRQLWELQPEENCPSVQCLREAGRLHGWHGAPEFQYYSRLVGFLRDECWASKILLWLIAATLKAKLRQKKGGTQSVWLVANVIFKMRRSCSSFSHMLLWQELLYVKDSWQRCTIHISANRAAKVFHRE